jgi:ABC-2 type transport system ATP-binding protein
MAQHRQLVGPRHDDQPITGVAAVLKASHTDRQSTLLVRTDGPINDPQWTVHDVPMEDVILTYLAEGEQQVTYEAWGVSA